MLMGGDQEICLDRDPWWRLYGAAIENDQVAAAPAWAAGAFATARRKIAPML
jgi:hypothetical protein